MAMPDGASSISVTVRVRPFTIREAAQLTKCDDGPLFLGDGSLAAVPTPKLMQKGIRPVIKVVDDKCLVFDPPEDNPVQRFSKSVVPSSGKRVKDQTFAFDRVFDENTSQGDVYEATTKTLLDSVLDGYNATVFAYGATGCGKTHTITGTAQHPGIIFLTMQELFERIADRRDEKETEVSLSYLEIYNETIRDLLVPAGSGSKAGLMLREDANQAVSVAGLSSHHPQNVKEVMDMIMVGNELRTMSPTEANATSSRSHAVLQINVSQRDRNADVNEPHTMATLSIIDLAGSERASATKNRGDRLMEGANINKSLLALGSCINALCDPRKKNHVPYRNSKLTRLLKFSLGGNCRTVMIVCVSPSSQHFDETQNTLRYANRAKNIQTKVTRNVYNVNRHVKDFLKKIDEQMALINELQQQQKDHEAAAYVKFKKQSEKREAIVREGITRLRNAHEHAATERQEKASNMKKLRQIERRISLLSAWIAAFDGICDARADETVPGALAAVRRTAHGVLVELEGSRQHYHQRLAKGNWERALDSALQTGMRQLIEVDGTDGNGQDVAHLTREAELLKSTAERQHVLAVLEQERGGEAAAMQVLLSAHFDTVASIYDIMSMNEAGAVEAAKTILMKIVRGCEDSTSQLIRADGALATAEAFPPTRQGTPKRRKQAHLGPSPLAPPPVMGPISAPHLTYSPVKSSPKRRKAGLGKKGVSFTPKKSPSKRAVRWRDDTENGSLAEFEKTPQKADSTPEGSSSVEPTMTLPVVLEDSAMSPAMVAPVLTSHSPHGSSSPLPTPPGSSVNPQPKNGRFRAGFLSKKSDGSPPPPQLTSLSSSDSDTSPLRTIELSKALNRSSLQLVQSASSDLSAPDSGGPPSSDLERGSWKADASDAMRIKSAMKRASSINGSTGGLGGVTRPQRRRSPGGASQSPPGNESALFTAGHARRMVKSDRENVFHGSVLSPRTAPVLKAGRRMTIGDSRGGGGGGHIGREPNRLSAVMGSGGRGRESAGTAMKVWR
ncbi:MAG: kinesin-like protein Klp5 [Thelocarpon superellum]|nr:MAG: kinesin-like protein Klp5 [Thelocarpon superellum]